MDRKYLITIVVLVAACLFIITENKLRLMYCIHYTYSIVELLITHDHKRAVALYENIYLI